jgi:hypothetical protein
VALTHVRDRVGKRAWPLLGHFSDPERWRSASTAKRKEGC